MRLRHLILAGALFTAVCLASPAAYAQDCGIDCTMYPVYYSWDTGGGFQPPTTALCDAWGWNNQRCRTCVERHTERLF